VRPQYFALTGIVGCCARTTSGHVAATKPVNATNSRRLIGRVLQADNTLLDHG
jgi:hypothetical protein